MDFPKQFIRATQEYTTLTAYVPAPYFRRSFKTDAEEVIQSAVLLIGTPGFYELHINGHNITKGALAPYRNNPDHFVYYDRYEIKDLVVSGKNVIAGLLGNGMQNSVVDIWDFDKAPWRGAPCVAFGIEIAYENGKKQTVFSDVETKVMESPILFNDLHWGEYYDARQEIRAGYEYGKGQKLVQWNMPGYDDKNWRNALPAPVPRGVPRLCEVEPIIIRERMCPVSIEKYGNGYIYDFGINNAGLCQLAVRGKEGQKIVLQHFEMLLDGGPYLKNNRFRDEDRFQEDEYICAGRGVEVHVPRFTYHGFRYVYVTGITEEQATEKLLTYLVMSSDIRQIGCFECDNETVNRIQQATVRSDISNFYYFPTDCPQREKNGWTGDISLSSEQLLLNLEAEKSLREWIHQLCRAMDDQGRLPGIVPTGNWGYDNGLNGIGWDNALVNIPYYIYMYRGNKEILKETVAPIMRYLTYLYMKLDENSLLEFGLGDWCQTKSDADGYTTPLILTTSILAVDIAEKAAFIFDVLRLSEQKEYAESLRNRVRKAIRKYLMDSDSMTVSGNTQTGQAMAIYYHIFEEHEKEKAVERLIAMIENNNGFMDVGVLGARVIFRVLAEHGYADLALHMISRPEFPSYGNWMEQGATTLWEVFLECEYSSMNHHFWGDVSAWFYLYLAGIRISTTKEGVRQVTIQPCFVKDVNYVKASLLLPEGKVSVKWQRTKDGIDLSVNMPETISEYRCFEEEQKLKEMEGSVQVYRNGKKVIKLG